jgi:hypothetical protein
MIVVNPDREWQLWVTSTPSPAPAGDRLGFIGSEVQAPGPPEDGAPSRRPIGFRMPEPTPDFIAELRRVAAGLLSPPPALPDWLLPEPSEDP